MSVDQDSKKTKQRKHRILWVFLALLLVLPALIKVRNVPLINSILDNIMESKLPDDVQAWSKSYWGGTFIFPEEAFEVEVLSDETLGIGKDLRALVETEESTIERLISKRKYSLLNQFHLIEPSDELTSAIENLKLKSPRCMETLSGSEKQTEAEFLNLCSILTKQPDYTMNAIPPKANSGTINAGAPLTKILRFMIDLRCLISIDAILGKDYEIAQEQCLLLLDASKCSKYDSFILKLYMEIIQSRVISLSHEIFKCIDDKNNIEKFHKDIAKRLNPQFNWDWNMPFQVTDQFGTIRYACARNIIAPESDPILGRELFIYFSSILMFEIPNNQEKLNTPMEIDEIISSKKHQQLLGRPRQNLYMYTITGAIHRMLSPIMMAEFSEIPIQHKVVRAKHELWELTFHDRFESASADPVTSSTIRITDVFSRTGAPYPKINNHYYSIGPDELDQQMAIQYNPINGSVSLGDIYLDDEGSLKSILLNMNK